MKKILFLDVDGVLNSVESFHANDIARKIAGKGEASLAKEFCWPLGHLSPPLIERLNTIVDKTDCHIVLSSSWRRICELDDFTKWLTQKGFRHANKFIGITDDENEDARGGQIQRWINANKQSIKSYAILDDDSWDIVGDATNCKHPNNFVHTDLREGLQDAQVEKAITLLNISDANNEWNKKALALSAENLIK